MAQTRTDIIDAGNETTGCLTVIDRFVVNERTSRGWPIATHERRGVRQAHAGPRLVATTSLQSVVALNILVKLDRLGLKSLRPRFTFRPCKAINVNRRRPIIGERIKRARVAAGLSQREVADRANLSAMAVSKFERGLSTPTSQTLIRLARALGTRTEFFLRPMTVELQQPEYRKRASLPKKQLARVEADILDQVERFLELLALFPTRPVARFEVPANVPERAKSYQEIEQAALAVREAWNLGHDAIPDLADTLEGRGLVVLTTGADTSSKFDGLAATVGDLPVVVVGSDWPGDRQRFTMAHELGHLILGGRLADDLDEEKACNRFAGAFLVPLPTVRYELGSRRNRLEPRELYALKHEYGVSMMAWVFRAADAGVITETTKTTLFRMFSANGWRKQEPGEPVGSEAPSLFEQLVLRALAEEMISTSKAAELMGMPIAAFRARLHFEESPRDAAHQ